MGEGKLERNGNLSEFSKELRREMTKEEKHLWYDFLNLLPVTVNRQKIIGNYIVDFFCASAKTVIELADRSIMRMMRSSTTAKETSI